MEKSLLSRILLLAVLLFAVTSLPIYAGSATWDLNPSSSDWNTAANWTPNTVPNGPADIATFDVSNQTDVTVSVYQTEVKELVFNPGASAFTITAENQFIISGTGITNNSGITQHFIVPTISNVLVFSNSATAGDMTVFTIQPSFLLGAILSFDDTSSAGHGTFIVEGDTVSLSGGFINFRAHSNAGDGFFMVHGGANAGRYGGSILFQSSASAGDGIFVINGGAVGDALGGNISFEGEGTAGNATLIANTGSNDGGGGRIIFLGGQGGTARLELFGNGFMDMSAHAGLFLSCGSIEGDGQIYLGKETLAVGANSLSTTFSGILHPGGPSGGDGSGALKKIGTGTLTLSGASTYTGGTTVTEGTLLVTNLTGSAAGTGDVQVDGGTLGGGGTVSGAITVGTGSGIGSVLDPSATAKKIVILVTQSSLTLLSDATYGCTIDFKNSRSTAVRANGVTINNAATIVLKNVRNGTLAQGKVFKIIRNTSANPISGTFSNLADGAIVNVGGTNFQADYQGGDGNDLTLTVVP